MTGITSFDFFNLPEIPTFVLCNPNKEEIYALGGISERKYSPRFNGISSLTFRADEYVDGQQMEYYEFLSHRRLVYVANLGYFMITAVSENGDGVTKYKEITTESLEVELVSKKLSLFKGTYQFYNAITPTGTLMQEILNYLPGWDIGSIDTEIAVKYRTFDVSDSTIYNFLMNDVEQAFECVFTFDTDNKEISVTTVPNATTSTDIYVSYDNLIQSITVDEITDNLVTGLTVIGGNGLSINRVNPLGTNNMYNLTYFKDTDWTNQALIDAITAWEALISANQSDYADYLADLLVENEALLTLQAELSELNTELSVLETELAALIAGGTTNTSAKNAEITAKTAEITAKTAEITAKGLDIEAVTTLLTDINDLLSFENNFTASQIIELQPFIIQSSYINENFALLDSMTAVEIQEEAQLLYDQAEDVLSKLSEPRYTFEVESVNLLFIKEFEDFASELELGAVINLEIKDGTVVYPVLLGFDLNYDNPTEFSLIFGNRLRLDDEAFQYSDLINEALSASTTSKVNSLQWSNWADTYKDSVTTFIDSSLNASLNNIISGSAQQIIIDENGLRGRGVELDGSYSDEQIWLVNNMIAFTDDNWDTAKMAIGNITSGSGNAWGIIANYLVGRVVAGNTLTITNDDSTFVVDGSGATLTDATLSVTTTDGKSITTIDPNLGIKIQTNIGGSLGDRFYVDTAGNLVVAGKITATSGYIGGWTINSSGLYYNGNNYIYPTAASLASGALVLSGGNATFTGTVHATSLDGTLDWNNLTNVPASKVSAGTLSGMSLSGASTLSGTGGTMKLYGSTLDFSSSGNMFIRSAGGGYISLNTETDLPVYLSSNSYIDSSKLASQSYVSSYAYSKGVGDARYAYKSHSHSGTYHPYASGYISITRVAVTTPFGTRYFTYKYGILTYYGT